MKKTTKLFRQLAEAYGKLADSYQQNPADSLGWAKVYQELSEFCWSRVQADE